MHRGGVYTLETWCGVDIGMVQINCYYIWLCSMVRYGVYSVCHCCVGSFEAVYGVVYVVDGVHTLWWSGVFRL